ncbi:ATP-binding protein [Bacteroides salyersiae]|uniref:ATP-binding protein n=1 Tax=Bacteroides salyersiae TaxID=291644 RepID=UPI001C8B9F17|nr:ATP-binding protein [Bacteroides salyersiae]
MAKLYPIGIQNFESLRNDGYFYVDKTRLIYKLANTGRYYFLSRPRRFGKSLLISTLEAYFQGKKELFQGLAIEELEEKWIKHPILHLDLNTEKYDTPQSLDNILNNTLSYWESFYGTEPSEVSIPLRFKGIVRRACEKSGQRVVILIDEYDKPMLQAIGNEELQGAYRSTLKAFYSVLKTMDGYIRFALLTGVTKFGKVSVFSDLNNLNDISMDDQYVELCGITEKEIHQTLDMELYQLAECQKMTYEDVCRELRERYDGYHFTEDSVGLYNPFSLLNTFYKMKFGNYWFETGTPSYLVRLLKRDKYDLERLTHDETTSDMLNSVDSTSKNPVPVIYQSGYLTIKGYDKEFDIYKLGFPNKEVEEGFMKYLFPFYVNMEESQSGFHIKSFVKEIRNGDYDAFFHRLQSFFADTPYELVRDLELHYQNVLFIVYKLLGFYVQAEYHTSNGRIDMILKTDKYIYVMEFKFDGSAEEALKQIEEKGYAVPFANDFRQLIKIGVNFSSKTRNIENWKVD